MPLQKAYIIVSRSRGSKIWRHHDNQYWAFEDTAKRRMQEIRAQRIAYNKKIGAKPYNDMEFAIRRG